MTEIDEQAMLNELRQYPDRFELVESDIGKILVLCKSVDTYFGWQQLRTYQRVGFDLVGFGKYPKHQVIETWNCIDIKYDKFQNYCIDQLSIYLDNIGEIQNYSSILKCINLLTKAISKKEIGISKIEISDNKVTRVDLYYPGIDLLYIGPILTIDAEGNPTIEITE